MRIGLIGNPNVGKSTIFNALTGMHQHTGNWPGKTVKKTTGFLNYQNKKIILEDLPGTYSLTAHSREEEVTRDFITSNNYDALIIVCDSSCLERNLNLCLQILEITNKVVICLNLIDEANKKGIIINQHQLSEILKVPVITTNALKKEGLDNLLSTITNLKPQNHFYLTYNEFLNEAISIINLKPYKALQLLTTKKTIPIDLQEKVNKARKYLYTKGLKKEEIKDFIAEDISYTSKKIAKQVITITNKNYNQKQYRLDKFLTGKITGPIVMLLMILFIFWITIKGANYVSDFLYNFLFALENKIIIILKIIHLPEIIINPLVYGILRTLFWVIAVMLPPMAIFFPLFTLLEDLGYLPRIAFNLDPIFQKCSSCGKQALTMSMGFGCNAAAVIGARIIDSPRERLIAILTNSLVPCNGRFPILISIITMFFITNKISSFLSALILTIIILISIIITFITSKLLSKTILKGIPSSFTLELPPYRRPQITKIIIRSIFEKTLFVLKRAIFISAPAGLIIWIFANAQIGNTTLLNNFTNFLDPAASTFGLDGVILMAFILGLPANEIVLPLIIMGYMSLGYLNELSSLDTLKNILVNNGWTTLTAICTIIFTLMHWPCLTTIVTIKKETNSLKWALFSILVPLLVGVSLCFIITKIYKLFCL